MLQMPPLQQVKGRPRYFNLHCKPLIWRSGKPIPTFKGVQINDTDRKPTLPMHVILGVSKYS